jgi:hypothetical protein
MSKGIIFIAIGEKWRNEAILAATKVKRFNPEIPITVFTDHFFSSPVFDEVRVAQPDSNPLLTKTLWMSQSPYEQTLFLDTDILLCDSIDDIFMLLDRFDLAVPHAPYRLTGMGLSIPLPDFLTLGVPDCFPGMNTGMILFNRSQKVQTFLNKWGENHLKLCTILPKAPNQPAFRTALYHSDLRFTIIPEEYHCRFIYPFKVCGKVKVLHGRHPDMDLITERINQIQLPRVGEGYYVELTKQNMQKIKPQTVTAKMKLRLNSFREHLRHHSKQKDLMKNYDNIPVLPTEGIPNGGTITLL